MRTTDWQSPWSEFDEERRAAALAHKEVRRGLRSAFRIAQQEAYEAWWAWQAELTEEAPTGARDEVSELEEERTAEGFKRSVTWERSRRDFGRTIADWVGRSGLGTRRAWGAAAAMVVVAFAAGLVGQDILFDIPSTARYVIPKPRYSEVTRVPGLGIGRAVNPEAERHFKEAMASYGDLDFPNKAIPRLQQSMAADPRFEEAQFWLGVAFLLKGDATAAISHLEAARHLAPGRTEYAQYLLWAYLKNGQTKKALALQTQLLGHP